MKMDLPSFDDRLHIEDFLDWVHTVENFFDYLNILEKNQVKLVAYKLKGGASIWWEQLQYNYQRQGKLVHTWTKMKQLLQGWFLPPDYEQFSYQQYQNCWQTNQTVNEYMEEFYRLNAWLNLSETEDQLIARYIGGLKLVIQDQLALQGVWTMIDAINYGNESGKSNQ